MLKKRSRINITLACVYILPVIGFFLRFVMLLTPTKFNPLMYSLYIILFFLGVLGASFVLFFIIAILKMDSGFSLKKQTLLTLFYATIIFIIINLPGAIIIDETTNWNPLFSWNFFIIFYFFFSLLIVAPYIVLSIKLYYQFRDEILRRKLIQFFFGFLGMALGFYGLTLYNTWDNEFFKIGWNIFGLVLLLLSGISIYYGTIQYV
ncbi:MAG: hypothetical protein ACFFAS_17035 [Promethearchaeota archaeon]